MAKGGAKETGPSKKTQEKKKDKTIEDLTFGLKNKNKSKVVQNYCKEVSNRVKFADVKVRVPGIKHVFSGRSQGS